MRATRRRVVGASRRDVDRHSRARRARRARAPGKKTNDARSRASGRRDVAVGRDGRDNARDGWDNAATVGITRATTATATATTTATASDGATGRRGRGAKKSESGARERAERERAREVETEEENARWDVQTYLGGSSPALAPATLSGLPPFPIATQMLQNMTQTNPFWAAQAMLHRGIAMGQSAALPQAGATTNGASAATDELTRKKLARKQSNRDSARRSRLRKQAETVEINVKVSELEREVVALREENQRLKKRLAENEGQRERKTTK